jgi:hypothetical protein
MYSSILGASNFHLKYSFGPQKHKGKLGTLTHIQVEVKESIDG